MIGDSIRVWKQLAFRVIGVNCPWLSKLALLYLINRFVVSHGSETRALNNWTRSRKDIGYQMVAGRVNNGMSDEGTIRDPMRLQNLISSLTASPNLPERFLLLWLCIESICQGRSVVTPLTITLQSTSMTEDQLLVCLRKIFWTSLHFYQNCGLQ